MSSKYNFFFFYFVQFDNNSMIFFKSLHLYLFKVPLTHTESSLYQTKCRRCRRRMSVVKIVRTRRRGPICFPGVRCIHMLAVRDSNNCNYYPPSLFIVKKKNLNKIVLNDLSRTFYTLEEIMFLTYSERTCYTLDVYTCLLDF